MKRFQSSLKTLQIVLPYLMTAALMAACSPPSKSTIGSSEAPETPFLPNQLTMEPNFKDTGSGGSDTAAASSDMSATDRQQLMNITKAFIDYASERPVRSAELYSYVFPEVEIKNLEDSDSKIQNLSPLRPKDRETLEYLKSNCRANRQGVAANPADVVGKANPASEFIVAGQDCPISIKHLWATSSVGNGTSKSGEVRSSYITKGERSGSVLNQFRYSQLLRLERKLIAPEVSGYSTTYSIAGKREGGDSYEKSVQKTNAYLAENKLSFIEISSEKRVRVNRDMTVTLARYEFSIQNTDSGPVHIFMEIEKKIQTDTKKEAAQKSSATVNVFEIKRLMINGKWQSDDVIKTIVP
jgi:hypothetical protein